MTKRLPENILCLCTENTVRSVMLEALLSPSTYIDSAGVDPVSFFNPITKEIIDDSPFSFDVVDPIGIDDVDVSSYDLVIAVSEPAYNYMKDHYDELALEYWTTSTPPMLGEVSRDGCLQSYRMIMEELIRHVENRFGFTPE